METIIEKQQNLKVLFLTSDPSNASRLHLGRELQSVRDKLEGNSHFEIKDHLATKPNDVMNEIMNFKPQIVHFSGHGSEEGELCFEDESGKIKTIPPEALASLFSLVTDYVKCVVINTCFAEKQAKGIARYIPVVIGTKKEISDGAAINFSTGFYTALNPDLSTESLNKAYKLGCIAIQFDGNLKEHLTPLIILGAPNVRFASEVDSAFSFISNPNGHAVKTLIYGLTLTGTKMGLTEEEARNIIEDKIKKLKEHKDCILEYEENLRLILTDEFPLSDSSKAALFRLQSGLNLSDDDVTIIHERILSDAKLDSAFSWYDRGYGQTQLDNYELAIKYFSNAIEKNNEYSAAYSGRGESYSKIKKFDLAIEDFTKAIELNINWEIFYSLNLTYFNRGLAYFDYVPRTDENVEKAKADWFKAIELGSNEPSAYYNIGLANKHLRKFDDAISAYKKALEHGYSDKTGIYAGIIKCYTEIGDKAKEIGEWTKKALSSTESSKDGIPEDYLE